MAYWMMEMVEQKAYTCYYCKFKVPALEAVNFYIGKNKPQKCYAHDECRQKALDKKNGNYLVECFECKKTLMKNQSVKGISGKTEHNFHPECLELLTSRNGFYQYIQDSLGDLDNGFDRGLINKIVDSGYTFDMLLHAFKNNERMIRKEHRTKGWRYTIAILKNKVKESKVLFDQIKRNEEIYNSQEKGEEIIYWELFKEVPPEPFEDKPKQNTVLKLEDINDL